jgi:hypothetical protein
VVVSGSEGDDLLVGGPGDDQFDGGPGIDRLQFLHPRDAYQWSRAFDGSFTVQGPEGTDKISGVERLLFGESILALDLAESQSTGQAALLLGAVLGKNLLLQKSELTRVVVELFDSGYSLEVLAGAIMRLPIWGGVLTPSDAPSDIATYLLTTVLGKLPSAEEISDAVWQMGSGPQGAFLASLALSQSNQGQVDLIGLQQTGLWLGASSSA